MKFSLWWGWTRHASLFLILNSLPQINLRSFGSHLLQIRLTPAVLQKQWWLCEFPGKSLLQFDLLPRQSRHRVLLNFNLILLDVLKIFIHLFGVFSLQSALSASVGILVEYLLPLSEQFLRSHCQSPIFQHPLSILVQPKVQIQHCFFEVQLVDLIQRD